MQCEICESNEANVHLKQVCNGMVREVHVCQECAAKHGFDAQSQLSLTDFLFGVAGTQQDLLLPGSGKSCPVCHSRWNDFKKTTRLGCSTCYETFSEDLEPVLASMHKKDQHIGKAPAGRAACMEAAALRKALGEAVAAQNFEEAARLRDRIREAGTARPAATETEKAKC